MTDSEFWKNLGFCTQCHKVRIENGESRCESCRITNRKNRLKRISYLKKQSKISNPAGTCYQCGAEIKSYKGLCDKCYKGIVIPDYIKSRG